jgi:hypothetical protein
VVLLITDGDGIGITAFQNVFSIISGSLFGSWHHIMLWLGAGVEVHAQPEFRVVLAAASAIQIQKHGQLLMPWLVP